MTFTTKKRILQSFWAGPTVFDTTGTRLEYGSSEQVVLNVYPGVVGVFVLVLLYLITPTVSLAYVRFPLHPIAGVARIQ